MHMVKSEITVRSSGVRWTFKLRHGVVPTAGPVWALVGLPEMACCVHQPLLPGPAGMPFPGWHGANGEVHVLLF